MNVMIGIDRHKASPTAAAIDPADNDLGQQRVRAAAGQEERLLEWAQAWRERTWAVENAVGLAICCLSGFGRRGASLCGGGRAGQLGWSALPVVLHAGIFESDSPPVGCSRFKPGRPRAGWPGKWSWTPTWHQW